MSTRFIGLAALVGLTVAWPSPSQAGHHLWKLTHVFSNATGNTQFIQLFTADNLEAGVGPFTVTASGHTFNFVNNLPSSSTANTWILIATANFAGLPGGVTPDYIIPAGFFSTGGGTLNYAGVDSWIYGAVPTDGVHALNRDGTKPVNVATNFAGQTGSVALTAAVPAVPRWGIALLVGALLLAGSGLVRRRIPAV
jgi:hypothetical protein